MTQFLGTKDVVKWLSCTLCNKIWLRSYLLYFSVGHVCFLFLVPLFLLSRFSLRSVTLEFL